MAAEEMIWVFFDTFHDGMKPPYVESPVANYKAPNAAASWVALGINGYVNQYNALIKNMHVWIEMVAFPDAAVATHASRSGRDEVRRYNALVKASREQLHAACAELKVPQPRHGDTHGVKYFLCIGVDMPG